MEKITCNFQNLNEMQPVWSDDCYCFCDVTALMTALHSVQDGSTSPEEI